MRVVVTALVIASMVGCGRSPAPDASKPASSVASAPDAASAPGVLAASGDPVEMARDLEALTGFLEVAARMCGRSGSNAEAVAKLRQAEAATYADRDELKMRVDQGKLAERNPVAWHRDIRKRMADTNLVARSCSKP